ncbi:hypothetical protein SVIOM342S_09389 [Streptomyces violaceorubidus]
MSEIRYFFNNPVAEKVREEGRVEGREEGRLEDRAGDDPPDSGVAGHPGARGRAGAGACRSDLDQLEIWARRAVTAERAEDLFSG